MPARSDGAVPAARACVFVLTWLLASSPSSLFSADDRPRRPRMHGFVAVAAWSPSPGGAAPSRARLGPPPAGTTTALRAENKFRSNRQPRQRQPDEESRWGPPWERLAAEPATQGSREGSLFSRSNSAKGGSGSDDRVNTNSDIINSDGGNNVGPSVVTRDMEEEVLSSVRASMDRRAVSRVIDESLRDDPGGSAFDISTEGGGEIGATSSSSAWTHQQIAVASGIAAFFLAPLAIQWLTPFNPSLEFSALLGTVAYILAMGDPLEEEGLGGAVSRIIGRTALKTAGSATPRIKAAARAAVTYPSSVEEAREVQSRIEGLELRVTELSAQNALLRRELALRDAAEDAMPRHRLEDLREGTRRAGLTGTSGDTKLQLMRKLARSGQIDLNLKPYLERSMSALDVDSNVVEQKRW